MEPIERMPGPPSDPSPGDRWTSPRDGQAMVWVPPGEFLMGSPEGWGADEEDPQRHGEEFPEHRVRVESGFWVDVTPVTNGAYARFVAANPEWARGGRAAKAGAQCGYLEHWTENGPSSAQWDHPVMGVSWHAARAYAAWAGKRLPSEAEWEYAARAGTRTAYWWGDEFSWLHAVTAGTKAVGDLDRVNPWGLADMLGNAREWTSSVPENYPYDSRDGREAVDDDSWRVVRGGSPLFSNADTLRCAYRDWAEPHSALEIEHVGFRCVQEVGAPMVPRDLTCPAGDQASRLLVAAPAVQTRPSSAPPRHPKPGDRWRSQSDGQAMVWVPAGEFLMGSPKDVVFHGEIPQHRVCLAAGFWLDVTPVTNEAYARFVAAHPEWAKGGRAAKTGANSDYLAHWWAQKRPLAALRDHPVVQVSWSAARAYAAWAGKRLPSEAEWEYAARAGTGTTYWWGDAFDPRRAANGDGTEGVGARERVNPWGLADMLGNVWECTSSKWEAYPYDARDGREDVDDGCRRVVRGGSWSDIAGYLSCAFRFGWSPRTCDGSVGFRCAQSGS